MMRAISSMRFLGRTVNLPQSRGLRRGIEQRREGTTARATIPIPRPRRPTDDQVAEHVPRRCRNKRDLDRTFDGARYCRSTAAVVAKRARWRVGETYCNFRTRTRRIQKHASQGCQVRQLAAPRAKALVERRCVSKHHSGITNQADIPIAVSHRQETRA